MHTHSLSKHFYTLRRSAASTLVALCSHSRRNQTGLLGAESGELYRRLMGTVLPGCGDALTQVGLNEWDGV